MAASEASPRLEFRDPVRARGLVERLDQLVDQSNHAPVSLMHVCGSHEQAIAKFGLRASFPRDLQVIMGPGCPVCVTPLELIDKALAIVDAANRIAGRNGIGRIDIVESRFVGMKSRGVYEAPGMTILYDAHLAIEQLTLDRDLVHLRDRLSPEVAEMVYYGFWYAPKLDALMAFIGQAMEPVTGEVRLDRSRVVEVPAPVAAVPNPPEDGLVVIRYSPIPPPPPEVITQTVTVAGVDHNCWFMESVNNF